MADETGKTGMGLEPNVAGLLCYVLGWLTGIIFFVMEKENQFVRFHAMQSIATFGALTVVMILLSILGMIPFIGLLFWIIQILVSILIFILWIILMLKAYQGQTFRKLEYEALGSLARSTNTPLPEIVERYLRERGSQST